MKSLKYYLIISVLFLNGFSYFDPDLRNSYDHTTGRLLIEFNDRIHHTENGWLLKRTYNSSTYNYGSFGLGFSCILDIQPGLDQMGNDIDYSDQVAKATDRDLYLETETFPPDHERWRLWDYDKKWVYEWNQYNKTGINLGKIWNLKTNRVMLINDNYIQFPGSGDKILIERNEHKRITKITSVDGKVYRFAYDENSRLLLAYHPSGYAEMYHWDNEDRITNISYMKGRDIKEIIIEYGDSYLNHDVAGRSGPIKKITGDSGVMSAEWNKTYFTLVNQYGYGYYKGLKSYGGHTYNAYGNLTKGVNVDVFSFGSEYYINTFESGIVKHGFLGPIGRFHREIYDNSNNYSTAELNKSYESIGDKISRLNNEVGIDKYYNYNSKGLLTNIVYEDDSTSIYLYNDHGQITNTIDREGNVIENEYNANGDLVKKYDPNGNLTEYYYHSTGQLSNIKRNGVYVYWIYYYENGLPEYDVNALGGTNFYFYDNNNLLIRTINPLGHESTIERDWLGRVTKRIDNKGNETEYTYTDGGRLQKIIYPDGTFISNFYDLNHALVYRKNRNDTIELFHRDELSRITNTVVKDSQQREIQFYDQRNYISRMIDGETNTNYYYYDKAQRLTNIHYADGGIEYFIYSDDCNCGPIKYPSEIIDQNGNSTYYTYNKNNQVTEILFADSSTIKYSYDSNGNMLSIEDQNGDKTFYEYNHLNKATLIDHPDGTYVSNIYDEAGNLIYRFKSDGDHIINENDFVYDSLGRMIRITNSLNKVKYIHYDENGNVTNTTDYDGAEYVSFYDDANRKITNVDPEGFSNIFIYADNQLVASIDPNGNIYSNYYDDDTGFLSSNCDPLGSYTSNIYNNNGRIVGYWDENENFYSIIYSNKKVSEVRFPDSTTNYYFYDLVGNLTDLITPMGTNEFEYNSIHKLIKQINALGNEREFDYDKNGNLTNIIDFDGKKSYLLYDEINRITNFIDKEGYRTYISYSNGVKQSLTDKNGHTYTFYFDELGRITNLFDPLNKNSVVNYNDRNQITNISDKNGNIAVYSYNMRGELTDIQFPDNTQVYFLYDGNGNLTNFKNQVGDQRLFYYDALNRLTNEVNYNGDSSYMFYDRAGNMTNSITYNGDTMYFEYDCMNRITNVIDQRGLNLTYEYSNSFLVKSTDKNGNETVYNYNINGVIKEIIDSHSQSLSFLYDELNQATNLINKKGNYKQIHQDSVGNITNIVNPSGKQTLFSYDGNRNLILKTDNDSSTTAYGFNEINLLTNIKFNGNEVAVFNYDNNGNVTNIFGYNTSNYYEYDSMNRLTLYSNDILIKYISYRYDELGRLTNRIDGEGYETTYRYDKESNLTNIETSGNVNIYFFFDELNRMTKKSNSSGTFETYHYENGLLTNIYIKKSDDTILNSFLYKYDNERNITNVLSPNEEIYYWYDNLNQVTNALYSNTLNNTYIWEEFAYDANGNRTSFKSNGVLVNTNIFDSDDKITSDGVFSYNYDQNGRLITKKNPINFTIDSYAYNWNNRATNIRLNLLSPSASTNDFKFDVIGRRIQKQEGSGSTVDILFDGFNGYKEYTSGGTLSSTYQFIGIDMPVMVNQSGSKYFYHQDILGSVANITDISESIVNSYKYNTYGEFRQKSTTINQPYTYSGREDINGSSKYYYRSRVYDSRLGGFQSEDATRNGFNWYSYVNGNPINYIDPFGYKKEDCDTDDDFDYTIHPSTGKGQLQHTLPDGRLGTFERDPGSDSGWKLVAIGAGSDPITMPSGGQGGAESALGEPPTAPPGPEYNRPNPGTGVPPGPPSDFTPPNPGGGFTPTTIIGSGAGKSGCNTCGTVSTPTPGTTGPTPRPGPIDGVTPEPDKTISRWIPEIVLPEYEGEPNNTTCRILSFTSKGASGSFWEFIGWDDPIEEKLTGEFEGIILYGNKKFRKEKIRDLRMISKHKILKPLVDVAKSTKLKISQWKYTENYLRGPHYNEKTGVASVPLGPLDIDPRMKIFFPWEITTHEIAHHFLYIKGKTRLPNDEKNAPYNEAFAVYYENIIRRLYNRELRTQYHVPGDITWTEEMQEEFRKYLDIISACPPGIE